MPRRALIRTAEFPYHITARSNNREWFYLPTDKCWQVFDQKLAIVSDRYEARVITFLLMSNHFHLLMKTPRANIDAIMNYLMREVSRTIGTKTGRINHIFGGRYKWCVIRSEPYLAHAYKYVCRNPVEAGIVKRVEQYRYSTLNVQMGRSMASFPIHDVGEFSCYIPITLSEKLNWLNSPYSSGQRDRIRRGLRRTTFTLSTRRNDQKHSLPPPTPS